MYNSFVIGSGLPATTGNHCDLLLLALRKTHAAPRQTSTGQGELVYYGETILEKPYKESSEHV
jgi:hypothetical protein